MATAVLELPTAVAATLARAIARLEPPPRLTISEFCDRELIVTTGPLAGTHWQTSFAPYQKGILDVFEERGVETAVVRGSSQFGKTSMAVGIVSYHVAHDPCPILIVEPTVDPMAKDFSLNRLDPIIAASPILRETVSKKRAKNSSNTVLAKTYRGGSLSIGGANSAASLAARSIRVLILDEIDRYPPELPGEGSTIAIALKRAQAYRGRRRIVMLSTPTLKGAAIDFWFSRGDQRRFFVPCPGCSTPFAFEWRHVQWKGPASSARIICPSCEYAIDDTERLAILGRGAWRPSARLKCLGCGEDRMLADPGEAELVCPSCGEDGAASRAELLEAAGWAPERGIVSFHIWEAYSPFSSLEEIVEGFLAARKAQKAGDPAPMHTWQNTTLGEPVEPERGEGVEAHALLLRREEYPAQAPSGVACVTMGVDTQDDRLEALVYGWGPGEEAWILDRRVLPGDTSQAGPWELLDELPGAEFEHATGQRLPISATCIDSAGHRTTMVYDYASRTASRRVFATIGRDGQRPIVSSPSPRKWGRQQRNVPLYTIGVDAAKALLVSRMALTQKGPGYLHIPAEEWADDELAAQLTSERLVTVKRKGIAAQVWRKLRPRNEALDCSVLALAALRLLRPDLELLSRRLNNPDEPPAAQTTPAAKPRGGWLGPRRRGWLK